jgi:Protein of unknown function (DUF1566)
MKTIICSIVLLYVSYQATESLHAMSPSSSRSSEKYGVRFTANTDGTLTDNSTGLMWIADPHDLTGNMQPHTWDEAIKFCEKLDYAHKSDWRLPTIIELLTLVDYEQKESALPELSSFRGVPRSNAYWTITSFAHNQLNAWIVDLKFGAAKYTNPKSAGCYVLPVRGQIKKSEQGTNGNLH